MRRIFLEHEQKESASVIVRAQSTAHTAAAIVGQMRNMRPCIEVRRQLEKAYGPIACIDSRAQQIRVLFVQADVQAQRGTAAPHGSVPCRWQAG